MAVEADLHSTAFDCENCNCTNGIAPAPKWKKCGPIERQDICYRYASRGRPQFLWSLFPHYKNGHLYRAGGVSEQPALYMSAMQFLQGYLSGRKD